MVRSFSLAHMIPPLLDANLLRRDQIWFTEKDCDQASRFKETKGFEKVFAVLDELVGILHSLMRMASIQHSRVSRSLLCPCCRCCISLFPGCPVFRLWSCKSMCFVLTRRSTDAGLLSCCSPAISGLVGIWAFLWQDKAFWLQCRYAYWCSAGNTLFLLSPFRTGCRMALMLCPCKSTTLLTQ